nr:MAG TPA: hypothetical protein [Caudoviricetes sp.]
MYYSFSLYHLQKIEIKKDDKNTFADTIRDLSKSLSSFRSARF